VLNEFDEFGSDFNLARIKFITFADWSRANQRDGCGEE
jgi:hypothetical protein